MKYLLTLLMASFFTLSANAQTISIGSQNVQLSVGTFNDINHVSVGAFKSVPVIGIINTRLGASFGTISFNESVTVKNGDTIKDRGVTEPNVSVSFMPSAMIGVDIPLKDFTIGVYSGYQSTIWDEVNHNLVPFSVSLSF